MNNNQLRKLIIEGIFDLGVSKDDYINAYVNKINREYKNLLTKASNDPNYIQLLAVDIIKKPIGQPNKCETNVFNFIKENLNNNKTNYHPVGGYLFENKSLFPVEHWWVYDADADKCIEITSGEGDVRFYAGIINYELHDEIRNATYFHDIDFFKGGNVYYEYFKI